jgi:hypothetical protein
MNLLIIPARAIHRSRIKVRYKQEDIPYERPEYIEAFSMPDRDNLHKSMNLIIYLKIKTGILIKT